MVMTSRCVNKVGLKNKASDKLYKSNDIFP